MKELALSQHWYQFVLMGVVCYIIGCFNFAKLIARFKHKDITKIGSGNPGTMNMSREFGLKVGIITFFLRRIQGGDSCAHQLFCISRLCIRGQRCHRRGLHPLFLRRVRHYRAYLPRHDEVQGRKGDRFYVGTILDKSRLRESVVSSRRICGVLVDRFLHRGNGMGIDGIADRGFGFRSLAGDSLLVSLSGGTVEYIRRSFVFADFSHRLFDVVCA